MLKLYERIMMKIKSVVTGFLKEFKAFMDESDFITVAIGFLVATAVKDLSTSFFTNIVTPILNCWMSLLGLNNTTGTVTIFGIPFGLSAFISQIFSFLFMLIIAFFSMKAYNMIFLQKVSLAKEEDDAQEQEEDTLKEILAELKKMNENK